MLERIAKPALHKISGNRKAHNAKLEGIAQKSKGKVVLEIGSGIAKNGQYKYSAQHLLTNCKEFVMTDINPDFGHKVLDITTMRDEGAYDIVLCLNVLEHVYDFQKAVDNLHTALRAKGVLAIAVPFTFPLHDEPNDYWCFTEHSLRKILSEFSKVKVTPHRSRRWPSAYFVTARK